MPELHSDTYYYALASLFYSVANADHNITREEKLRIIEQLELHPSIIGWREGTPHQHALDMLYAKMRELIGSEAEPETAFKQFQAFYKAHRAEFSEPLKVELYKVADSIAYANSSRNKSEVAMLARLELLFMAP